MLIIDKKSIIWFVISYKQENFPEKFEKRIHLGNASDTAKVWVTEIIENQAGFLTGSDFTFQKFGEWIENTSASKLFSKDFPHVKLYSTRYFELYSVLMIIIRESIKSYLETQTNSDLLEEIIENGGDYAGDFMPDSIKDTFLF